MSNRLKPVSIFSLLALLATAAWSGYSHYSSSAVESSPLADPMIDTADQTHHSPPSSQSSVASADQDRVAEKTLAQLKTELNRLREQLKSERQQNAQQLRQIEKLSNLLASSDTQNDLSCEDEVDDDALIAEELEQERALMTHHAELLEEALVSEPVDAQESDKLNTYVADLFQAKGLSGSTLVDVECSVSLCRVELYHQNQDAQNAFIEFSPLLLERHGESFTQVIEYSDGGSGAVLFLSREGFSLSEVET